MRTIEPVVHWSETMGKHRTQRSKRVPYTIDQVERHAAALSADHHEVMATAVDLPMNIVAEKLNLPIGTVKSRLNRARAMLKELEEKHGQET